jgi:hypothetical protein
MDSLQHSAVLFCQFANSKGIHIVNKASPNSSEGGYAEDFDKVGIVEHEEDGQPL